MTKVITAEQLSRAFKRSPKNVAVEIKKFITRGLAVYKKIVVQERPWRVGQSGGGVPRETGNLREMHSTFIKGLEGRFGVYTSRVKYARYIHEGTKKMVGRPWLDYAEEKGDKAVEKHYKKMGDNIIKQLAS